jgi:hypothetical protein
MYCASLFVVCLAIPGSIQTEIAEVSLCYNKFLLLSLATCNVGTYCQRH